MLFYFIFGSTQETFSQTKHPLTTEKTTDILVLPQSSSAYHSLSSCIYNKQGFKSKEKQKRVTFSLLKDLT